MKTISIEVKDDIFQKVLDFLKILPNDSCKIIDYENDDQFTDENKQAYQKAMQELKNDQLIDLEDAKKAILGVRS